MWWLQEKGKKEKKELSIEGMKEIKMTRELRTCSNLTLRNSLFFKKNMGWKRWEYQTTWPASWESCMQVKKQQLELDMEQQTSSK